MPITPADMATERYFAEAYEYLRNWILEHCGPVAALNAQRAWEREWARCRPVRPEMERGERRG